MAKVLNEIIPITEKDCFFIVERHKSEFTYPLHRHRDFELNFVENAAGAQRVVGDSSEYIGEYDLVLIGGENLEHVWKQGNCPTSRDIREITIQFPADLFTEDILSKNQFASIRDMLTRAEHGLAFPLSTHRRAAQRSAQQPRPLHHPDRIGQEGVPEHLRRRLPHP